MITKQQIMRISILLLFLLFECSLFAQKPLQYNAYLGGKYMQAVLITDSLGNIEGYYVDFQTKEKVRVTGQYHELGEWMELKTDEPNILFKYIRARINRIDGTFKGYYYNWENYIGNITLSTQEPDIAYEENRDIANINDIYLLMRRDFKLPAYSDSKPFQHDILSGKYYLVFENGEKEERGIQLQRRKMLEYAGLHVVFRDLKWSTDSDFYECNLHLQVLTYYPTHLILAVAEEKSGDIKKSGDTSLIHRFSFAVYEKVETEKQGELFWKNVSKSKFPSDMQEKMLSKTIGGKVTELSNYYQLEFDRKCILNVNIPNSYLLVPIPGNPGKKNAFNWSFSGEMKFLFE